MKPPLELRIKRLDAPPVGQNGPTNGARIWDRILRYRRLQCRHAKPFFGCGNVAKFRVRV